VKTKRFSSRIYIGDAVNAVRIFNDKEVDELFLIDIDASRQGRRPNFPMIKEVASECFSPLAYGGGVASLADAEELVQAGVEKVVFNSAFLRRPGLIREVSRSLGAASVVVSIDAHKPVIGGWQVFDYQRGKGTGTSLIAAVESAQELGAGELLLTDVKREGRREGPDDRLMREVSGVATTPVVFNGGVRSIDDIRMLLNAGASAVAAGAMFVLHGRHDAVLISYPSPKQIDELSRTREASTVAS
jgi:cyclase